MIATAIIGRSRRSPQQITSLIAVPDNEGSTVISTKGLWHAARTTERLHTRAEAGGFYNPGTYNEHLYAQTCVSLCTYFNR